MDRTCHTRKYINYKLTKNEEELADFYIDIDLYPKHILIPIFYQFAKNINYRYTNLLRVFSKGTHQFVNTT